MANEGTAGQQPDTGLAGDGKDLQFGELIATLFGIEEGAEQAEEAEGSQPSEADEVDDEAASGEADEGEPSEEEEPLNQDEVRMYGIQDLDEETQRKLLPYLKKVAANYNKLHQKAMERLRAYEAFGSPEDIENAVSLLNAAAEDPLAFIAAMRDNGIISAEEADELSAEVTGEDAYEGPTDEEVARMMGVIEEGVSGLKAKYGDFDERLLLPFLDPSTLDFEAAYRDMVASAYRVSRSLVTPVPDVRPSAPQTGDVNLPRTIDEATRAALEYLRNTT